MNLKNNEKWGDFMKKIVAVSMIVLMIAGGNNSYLFIL